MKFYTFFLFIKQIVTEKLGIKKYLITIDKIIVSVNFAVFQPFFGRFSYTKDNEKLRNSKSKVLSRFNSLSKAYPMYVNLWTIIPTRKKYLRI